MKQNIDVKVFAKAKKTLVKQESGLCKVYLTAPAVDGKANKALIGVMADYFGVRKSQIQIIKGLKSPYKTISIEAFK